MTIEEIRNLGVEELEQRAAQIAEETADANKEQLEALNAELDAIEERKNTLKAEAEKRNAAAAAVAGGAGEVVERRKEIDNMPTNREVRNSREYIEAFAKYIKTGKDAECRALLSENVSGGVVPVPEMVENRIRQAWETDEVWNRITKTFVRGNLKVGFEISSTDAVIHTEGAAAPAEEMLILGIVTMVPANIKKWITVSDEVLALGAEDFLAYIYDELTYKIIKKAADQVIAVIQAAPSTASDTAVAVAQVSGTVSAATILEAMATLGDEATDKVVIADGSTIAAVRLAALTANYAYDPFFGMTVIQKDGVTGAIVGDLSGVQANMPEGDAVTFKFDDLSLAEKDMVKIVARLYAAIAVVGPKMFAVISGEDSGEDSE